MAEIVLNRAERAVHRRVEKWMMPRGWKGPRDFDDTAYRRMADQLIGAMTAVGPAHSEEGIAALIKTLALIGHQTLLGADETHVREFGDAAGKMIATEILGLRLDLLPRRSRRV